MLILLILLVVVGFGAVALLVLAAASVAERAVRLAGVERRRDHWRRIGEASHDVQQAADDYRRAMEISLRRNGGDDNAARRVHEVTSAARQYQESCRRLRRVLAGGPPPPRSRRELMLLTDGREPETVAAARPLEPLLSELTYLQDSLDRQVLADEGAARPWRVRGSLRLALLSARERLRGLSRV